MTEHPDIKNIISLSEKLKLDMILKIRRWFFQFSSSNLYSWGQKKSSALKDSNRIVWAFELLGGVLFRVVVLHPDFMGAHISRQGITYEQLQKLC